MPLFPGDTLLLLSDAAPAAASPGAGFAQTLPLVGVILVIFYFLLWRPQQKQVKEQETLLASLQKNDRVITGSGLHGTIHLVEDTTVTVEIADGVRVVVEKSSIRRKIVPGTKA